MRVTAKLIGVALIAIATLSAAPAWATDWIADKLRGPVHFLSDGEWQELVRGDELPDGVILRTGKGGRVELRRGKEVMNLGSSTQIRVIDRAPGEKFTNVYQDFGSLDVDVEKRNVRHFAVITRQLAAVVKGTRFTVNSNNDGAMVKVVRGVVQVQDSRRRTRVDIRPGQQAGAGKDTGMALFVSGDGALPKVVDMETGDPVSDIAQTAAQSVNDIADGVSNGVHRGLETTSDQLNETVGNTVEALTGNGNSNGNSNSNSNNGSSGGEGSGGGLVEKLTNSVGGLL